MKIGEYKQMMDYLTGPREGFQKGNKVTGLNQKYLYKKGNGYRVVAYKGNEKINKYFPKDQLKEARAYAKEVEENLAKIEAKPPRKVTGKKLTVYNKYGQDLYGKDYNDLTKAEKNIVQTRYRQSDGKFRKTFQTDALTDLNKERIKKAFPDVEFEFTKGKKYGVVQTLKNGKRNPVFTAVNNFVRNDYKLSVKKSLPVSTQRDIVANFELPKGVKEWNFDVKKGGYLYGIPDTAGANENLGKRIINFVNEPKPYKIAADFGNAEGWLLTQMNRAFESGQNPNFIPKYDLVNGKKKIVGFTDNQYGGGKTYYALKKYANKFNGTMMTEHPDFKNTKKFIDIANRVKLAPNKVIKDLLIKGGVTNDRVTLNNLLQYMVNEKGVEATKRGLVLHHKGGVFANPTRDFQILNTAINQNIKGVELAMRSDPKNITPKNIKFLEDAGASIIINGKTYGGGPKTAIGGFRQAEQFVQEKLKDFSDKDFQNLNKYLAAIGCPDKVGKAMGGRIGFQEGTVPTQACITKGANIVNQGNVKNLSQAQRMNLEKFLKLGYRGIRAITKYGIIPEAIFATGESLLRVGMGDTLPEAFLRSIDYLVKGDQTAKAQASKIARSIGKDEANLFKDVAEFRAAQKNLESAKSNMETNQAVLDESGFGYTANIDGISQREIDEQRIKKAKKELFLKKVSPDTITIADYFSDLADDKEKAKSFFTRALAKQKEFAQTLAPVTDESGLNFDLNSYKGFNTKPVEVFPNFRDTALRNPDQIIDDINLSYRAGEFGPVGLESSRDAAAKDAFEDIKAYDFTKTASLNELADKYGKEQIYGFNPENFLFPINQPVPFERQSSYIQSPFQREEENRLIEEGARFGAAGGGIAGLSGGIDKGPQVKSMNPDSGGLAFLKNNVKKL